MATRKPAARATTPTGNKSEKAVKVEKIVKPDPARLQALTQFSNAVRLLQESKFEKAKAAFEKLLTSAPPDLIERTRTYIVACDRQLNQQQNKFETLEERYDYAISLLNTGLYEDARSQFDTIVKKAPHADYAFYGLAVLASMTCQTDACLQHLTEAIRLNERNRLQARGDSDFMDMADDPRFTELLYPEVP
jgi:tetratricopeptide (TPR) repeat protein